MLNALGPTGDSVEKSSVLVDFPTQNTFSTSEVAMRKLCGAWMKQARKPMSHNYTKALNFKICIHTYLTAEEVLAFFFQGFRFDWLHGHVQNFKTLWDTPKESQRAHRTHWGTWAWDLHKVSEFGMNRAAYALAAAGEQELGRWWQCIGMITCTCQHHRFIIDYPML